MVRSARSPPPTNFRNSPHRPNGTAEDSQAAYARAIRAATRLTQAEFAARIGVPIETVRNWEQGKRSPRGPARALLKLIENAPDLAFAVLAPGHHDPLLTALAATIAAGHALRPLARSH